jgi:urocanate hydratase
MFLYYAGLCAIRTSFSIFTDKSASVIVYEHKDNQGFNIVFNDGRGGKAVAVFNPGASAMKFTLDGTYHVVCNGSEAAASSLGVVSGEISIPGYSGCIYVNDAVLNSAK